MPKNPKNGRRKTVINNNYAAPPSQPDQPQGFPVGAQSVINNLREQRNAALDDVALWQGRAQELEAENIQLREQLDKLIEEYGAKDAEEGDGDANEERPQRQARGRSESAGSGGAGGTSGKRGAPSRKRS